MILRDPPARPSTEERIVDAAAQLFSRHGFNGTRTREIARLADVNQTTLFRYFARKRDLFGAALRARLSRVRMRRELRESLAADADPGVVLPMILEFLVVTIQYQPELMRLLYFTALELGAASERICKNELQPIFGAISDYLQRSIDRAALRPVDPLMTTVAFTTTVAAHQALHSLIRGAALPYASAEEAVSAYSEFWLGALVPDGILKPPQLTVRPLP